MPEDWWNVDYDVLLEPPNDYLRVRIRTERGQVVDFVVQYETTVGGRVYPVVRYDGSHGRVHRDVLDAHGETIEGGKQWFPEHLSLADGVELARSDFLKNWARYRDMFLRRMR